MLSYLCVSLIEAETGKERKIAAGLKVQLLQTEVIVYRIKVPLTGIFYVNPSHAPLCILVCKNVLGSHKTKKQNETK